MCQSRYRAWLQGRQCKSPVRLGTWPANSKPLKSVCTFIDHSLKAPATVSPGFPCRIVIFKHLDLLLESPWLLPQTQDFRNVRAGKESASFQLPCYWRRNWVPRRCPEQNCCCLYCWVSKSCLTLCDPMDCSPPGFSVHGISQARVLEWVAISFSRGSSWTRDRTHVSWICRWILYFWATRKPTVKLDTWK